MTEPAKDEAELLNQVARARCECQPGGCYALDGGMYCHASEDYVASVITAIRAAGWAVVPQEPTMDMIGAAATRKASEEHSLYFGIYEAMLAAAPGVKP